MTIRRVVWFAMACTATALLTGCGSDAPSDGSTSATSAPTTPAPTTPASPSATEPSASTPASPLTFQQCITVEDTLSRIPSTPEGTTGGDPASSGQLPAALQGQAEDEVYCSYKNPSVPTPGTVWYYAISKWADEAAAQAAFVTIKDTYGGTPHAGIGDESTGNPTFVEARYGTYIVAVKAAGILTLPWDRTEMASDVDAFATYVVERYELA